MRILSVITRLNIGGVSPPVISLTAGLREYGHESRLVVGLPGPKEGTMEADAEKAGVPLVRIRELQRAPDPRRDSVALIRLVRLFRALRPDVVATHMAKAGALGRLAARLARVPVVVHTYHGQGFQVFEERWKESVALSMERWLARLSTGNIVVSETQFRRFLRLGIGRADKIRVIRYGLDLEPFVAAPTLPRTLRKDLGLTEAARLIGVVARVISIKGQDVLLRAAGHLAHDNPALHFVIAGDGAQREEFQALARTLGLEERVHFLGWRRDIPFVLANLDVVVLPTVLDFEGVPLALIEALATGRPVVATRVGGVGELVRDGETGLLVEPRDDAGLARAIASLVGDPARMKALAEGGQRLVTSLYQRDRMIAETERFYRECFGKR